jgi:thiol-disulfide isomerase/thioredoxin
MKLAWPSVVWLAVAAAAQSPAPTSQSLAPSATRPATRPASAPASQPRRPWLPLGTVAPAFEGITLDGEYVRFPADFPGQLVLLHVWASWCPSCARDFPYWVRAQAEYGDRGLALLGLSVDYGKDITPDKVQSVFAERHGNWRVIYQQNGDLEMRYRAMSLPTLYLVDGDTGRIVANGDDLRRGRLAKTLAAQMAAKFPDRFPASQPATAPTSQPLAP